MKQKERALKENWTWMEQSERYEEEVAFSSKYIMLVLQLQYQDKITLDKTPQTKSPRQNPPGQNPP